jgi:hypothetical protein
MGQKVTPTSLRLGLNRHFDSCYYQEIHYADLLAKDLSFQSYVQSFLNRIGVAKGRIFSDISFKKQNTYMFVFPEKLHQQLGRATSKNARSARREGSESRRDTKSFTHLRDGQHAYFSYRAPFQSTHYSHALTPTIGTHGFGNIPNGATPAIK